MSHLLDGVLFPLKDNLPEKPLPSHLSLVASILFPGGESRLFMVIWWLGII